MTQAEQLITEYLEKKDIPAAFKKFTIKKGSNKPVKKEDDKSDEATIRMRTQKSVGKKGKTKKVPVIEFPSK